MRSQRNKQFDWSKPFKLVTSQRQFQQIQTGQDIQLPIQSSKQQQSVSSNYKKQNIITPKIQTVPRITSVKPFARITPNYIRLSTRLNIPRLIDYELTQVDHVFVKTHENKYKFKGKVILTEEFMIKVFIQLELRAGKDPVIPRSKKWMTDFLEKYYKELLEWDNVEVFASMVYNFWKNRREYVKFPLLRSLWRPNPDEFNHLLAFKPREKQKRNLRKTTRISQDQILGELYDQFQIAKEITQRVQLRQELRLKQLMSQLAIFHNQCKGLFGVPDFVNQIYPQLTVESRVKDKQKLKQSHQRLDKLKTKRQQPYEVNVDLPAPVAVYQSQLSHQQQVYDQKLSIASFLSTVICQAQNFGINYNAIFESKSQILQPVILQQNLLPILKQQQPKKQQPYVNMSLYKQDDMIIREFSTNFYENQYDQSQSSSYVIDYNILKSNEFTHDNQMENQQNFNNQNIFEKNHKINKNQQNMKKITKIKNNLIMKSNYKRCHQDVIDYFKSKVSGYYVGDDDQFQGRDLRKNIAGSFKKFQAQFRQM